MRRRRGFSLTELVVVLAIAAIIAAVGIVQLVRFQQNSAFKAQVEQIVSDLKLSRQTAITRGSRVAVGAETAHPILSNVQVDQIVVQFKSDPPLLARHYDPPVTLLSSISKGPDVAATDLANALVIRAYFHGAAIPWVAAFDGTGRAVWQNTTTCTNGRCSYVISLDGFNERATLVQ